MPKDKNKTVTSRTGRAFKLAGMTASVAGRYAKNKVRSVVVGESDEQKEARKRKDYALMADEIANTLGELKGAVMKVGQIASQTQDLFPKEFSEALKRLQKEAPPVDFDVIKKQIESNLGQPLEKLFRKIDKNPHASASIGQVHRATTHEGKEVVVKVQYPAVAKSVESDLKQLKLTLKLGGLLKLPKESVDSLFLEIQARLKEELDYEQEAKNVELFRRFHSQHEGILIPQVISELSTSEILTLEYLPGDDIQRVKESELYDENTIVSIGYKLFEIMAEQLFVLGQIHGDPHPGNFAFRPDGSVIVYDFGCVKRLKAEIVRAYKEAIVASIDENYAALDNALIALGARVANQPSPGPDYYKVWRNIFFEPFLSKSPYDYENSAIHIEAAKHTNLFFKHMSKFKPPVESIYIDRMVSGQFWIMKSLGVKADFRCQLDDYLSKS